MKPQVRWTSREWALLAQYFLDVGIDPDAYGFSRALDHAQKKVLPPERHRAVKGVPAQLKKEIKTQIGILKHQQREEATMVKPPEPKPPSAESLSTEELLVELARRIAKMLQPQIIHNPVDRAFHPLTTENTHHPKAVEQVTKLHKLRVLVCGPNGDTSRSLTADFPNLDLRFVEYDTNPAKVHERANHVDVILCIRKFVKHSTVDAAHATGETVVLVTSVREAREWLSKQNCKRS